MRYVREIDLPEASCGKFGQRATQQCRVRAVMTPKRRIKLIGRCHDIKRGLVFSSELVSYACRYTAVSNAQIFDASGSREPSHETTLEFCTGIVHAYLVRCDGLGRLYGVCYRYSCIPYGIYHTSIRSSLFQRTCRSDVHMTMYITRQGRCIPHLRSIPLE